MAYTEIHPIKVTLGKAIDLYTVILKMLISVVNKV